MKLIKLHQIINNYKKMMSNEEYDRELFENIMDLETIYEYKNVHMNQSSIYSIDWSSSGKMIASASNDLTIKISNTPKFRSTHEL